MKTILILTIGTRDVRLSADYATDVAAALHVTTYTIDGEPLLMLSSTRDDGKIVADNLEAYLPHLRLPITQPAVAYVLSKEATIDKIFFVVTDQAEVVPKVEKKHIKKDTLHLAPIIEYVIKKAFPQLADTEFGTMKVDKGVLEYDTMYKNFEATFRDGFLQVPEDSKVYIQPQGGIDAINFPLLLRCIERYPKTVHLAKPEGQPFSLKLSFPDLFVQNLKKHKIVAALQNFDYSAVVALDHSEAFTRFARFAYHLTALNFDAAQNIIQNFTEKNTDEKQRFIRLQSQIYQLRNDKQMRIKHLYLMAKIRCHQGAFDDFLIKIFTINEQLLIPKAKEIIGQTNDDIRTDWMRLINANTALKTYLDAQTYNGYQLNYRKPKRTVYRAIYDFKYAGKHPEFDELCDYLESLSLLRNKAAHDVMSVNKNAIEDALRQSPHPSPSMERLLDLANQYFSIQAYGIFDEINDLMLNYFLKNTG